jgi:hypothetical protein
MEAVVGRRIALDGRILRQRQSCRAFVTMNCPATLHPSCMAGHARYTRAATRVAR